MNQKIIAIVGPTASGKSAFAVELALRIGGEIVSADSRQVYRGLDLGTGKITMAEMRGVPHHLLNIADPRTVYTGADFVRDGDAAVAGILARGHTPILCGGSGFYLDLFAGRRVASPVKANPELRAALEHKTTDELVTRLTKLSIERAREIDPHNRVRLIRALEIALAEDQPKKASARSMYNIRWIGIVHPPVELRARIEKRLDDRLAAGMVEEVARLRAEGVSDKRLLALGLEYREITRHLRGESSHGEMRERLARAIWHYARRQMTWFRANKAIEWVSTADLTDPALYTKLYDRSG